MTDMLVKLYTLPDSTPFVMSQKVSGIDIRRALPSEKQITENWVCQEFNEGWGSESDVAFSNHPISCFLAIKNKKIVGFACYDVSCKNYFGPMGITETARGRGTGKALLLSCLHAMASQGYAYAIIGGVGPTEFYCKTVGAVVIKGSEPGIYRGMLKK